MPTSQTGSLAEILSGGSLPLKGEAIPPWQLAYFRERLKGRIFSFIIRALKKQQQEDPTITQAAIARRLGRRPEQINRWLSGPSNLTVESISDLVLAAFGGEPSLEALDLRAVSTSQAGVEPQDDTHKTPPPESIATGALYQKLMSTLIDQAMTDADTNLSDEALWPYDVGTGLAPNLALSETSFLVGEPAFSNYPMQSISQPIGALTTAAYPSPSYFSSSLLDFGTFVPQGGLFDPQIALKNQAIAILKRRLGRVEYYLAQARQEAAQAREKNRELQQRLTIQVPFPSDLGQRGFQVRLRVSPAAGGAPKENRSDSADVAALSWGVYQMGLDAQTVSVIVPINDNQQIANAARGVRQ
jgi:hypothetical protein